MAIAQARSASPNANAARRQPDANRKTMVSAASGRVTAVSPKSVTKFQKLGRAVLPQGAAL
jgi:hypothetical protein